jgi:hypothetical protein
MGRPAIQGWGSGMPTTAKSLEGTLSFWQTLTPPDPYPA